MFNEYLSPADISVITADDYKKYIVYQRIYDDAKCVSKIPAVVVDDLTTAWQYIEQRVYQFYEILRMENRINDVYIRIDVDGVYIAENSVNFILYTIEEIRYIK